MANKYTADNYKGSGLSKGAYLKTQVASKKVSSKPSSSSKISSSTGKISSSGKDLSKAFDQAIGTYKDMLPSLKPRYDALVSTIDQSKTAAIASDTQTAGQEDTTLKQELASRGLEVNSGNTFYNQQNDALQVQQDSRASGVAATYDAQVNQARIDQGQAEQSIKDAIANLLVQKGQSKYKVTSDELAQKQWELTFQATQDQAAADQAIKLRQMALDEMRAGGSGTGSNKLNNDIATMVGTAYAGGFGNGQGIRENIVAQLSAKYPGQQKAIQDQVFNYLPNGWEGRIYNNSSKKSYTNLGGGMVMDSDGNVFDTSQ
jgi:hypothetical protein